MTDQDHHGAHDHVWVVRRLNDLPSPIAAPRPGLFWRISVCDVCEAWHSEGAFEPWPDTPGMGDLLYPVTSTPAATDVATLF